MRRALVILACLWAALGGRTAWGAEDLAGFARQSELLWRNSLKGVKKVGVEPLVQGDEEQLARCTGMRGNDILNFVVLELRKHKVPVATSPESLASDYKGAINAIMLIIDVQIGGPVEVWKPPLGKVSAVYVQFKALQGVALMRNPQHRTMAITWEGPKVVGLFFEGEPKLAGIMRLHLTTMAEAFASDYFAANSE